MNAETQGNGTARAVVLYDADCGFCRWSVGVVLSWDRHCRLRAVAIQSEEGQLLLEAVPVEIRLDSFHLAEPGGRVSSAGDAAAPMLRRLPGGALPARLAARFPVATNRAYFFIARRRSFFGRLLRRLGRIPEGPPAGRCSN